MENGKRGRLQDRGLLAERGEREQGGYPYVRVPISRSDRRCLSVRRIGGREVNSKGSKSKRGGEDVGVREGALCVPDRVRRGEQRDGEGSGGGAEQAEAETIDG